MTTDITSVTFEADELKAKAATTDDGVANKKQVDTSIAGITKTTIGLGDVDNTSDAAKPVSTATQTALNAKQNTLTKALGTDVATGTDDAKYATSKAIKDGGVAYQADLEEFLKKTDAGYLTLSFHTQQLTTDVTKTPSGNLVELSEIDLEIPVEAGDIIETNSSLAADYSTYNDIGDVFFIQYKVDAGAIKETVTLGKITGGDNNQETAAGNLYTPILMESAGTLTLSVKITTKTNASRKFLASHCGILVKLLRKPV